MHSMVRTESTQLASDFVIRTQTREWVIPYNCEILKALLLEQELRAVDLKFYSDEQCHGFIKRLLLLAAQDECRYRCPSKIAVLARDLIHRKPSKIN